VSTRHLAATATLFAACASLAAASLGAEQSVQAYENGPPPFSVGERSEYDVKYGFIRAGSSALEVLGIDTIRGRDAYRFQFHIAGGVPFYKIRDTMWSWADTATFESLRYIQDNEEGGKSRYRHYDIFPERLMYIERGHEETESVPNPLDDLSFLYFVRTRTLEVGREYAYPQYFKPAANPVTLRVLRRERVKVPLGTYDAIVVQPSFKSRGIFSEGGQAQVWISADSARIILKVTTKIAVASLSLELKAHRPGVRPQDSSASPGVPGRVPWQRPR
jgi:hypothetical protein